MAVGPDKDKFVGTKFNITIGSAFETETGGLPKKEIGTNVTDMQFNNYIGFKAYFNWVFKDPMLDQKPFIAVWASNETDNSLYNNWTFPNMYVWDDFFYSPNNRRLLTTDYITVGKESLQSTQFDITIFQSQKNGIDQGNRILGFSYKFANEIHDKVHFSEPELNLNDAYKLGLKNEFKDRNVVFKFKIDYT